MIDDKLKIDKENDDVCYNDELHKYWVKNTKQSCISVTTLIHKFQNFDEDFWSSYKTLERIISPEDFKSIKGTLLKSKQFYNTYLEMFAINEETFFQEKQVLLKEWEEKREASCIRGSLIHKEQELLNLSGNTPEIQKLKLGGNFITKDTNRIEPGVKGVYPELLLSRVSEDGKFRLAGQADLIIVDEFDVYVIDYKTGKSMDTKAYYDRNKKKHETMKYPLNNIQDTNFWHYTLQLSTYAWMIQKIDPRFNIKMLLLIHIDHDNVVTDYECEYRKADVERMLMFYRKQLEHEEFMEAVKKLEF